MSPRTKLLQYMVETGKLLPREPEPATEEEKAENSVEWELPLTDSPLRAAVRALTDASEHPLIQPDILDAVTLLTVLKDRGDFPYLSARRLGMELRKWYFRPLGPVPCDGKRFNLWTSLPTQSVGEIVKTLRHRLNGQTEKTGVLTPFERDVLTHRLRQVGLRYFRPREIAVMLGCHPSAVYAASQSIAKKLGIRGAANIAALHAAVRESGALMDDPAFR